MGARLRQSFEVRAIGPGGASAVLCTFIPNDLSRGMPVGDIEWRRNVADAADDANRYALRVGLVLRVRVERWDGTL
jgi:hypothetical protein